MKVAINVCKAVALLFSAAVLVLFFADFIVVKTAGEIVTLTGAELALRSRQTVAGAEVEVARSSYYLFTFIFVAASALFAGLAFKFKKTNVASLVCLLVTSVMAIVFLATGAPAHVDTRPLTGVEGIRFTWLFIIFSIVTFAAALVTALSVLIIDAVEAKAAGRETIPQKVVRFVREYFSEIRKVIWPGPNAVVRGTIVVLIMCAIAGSYVWLLDLGLGRLIGLILGIDL